MKRTVLPILNENRSVMVAGSVAIVILLLLPIVMSRFWLGLLTEILILGLAGMSVNLLLGYGGSIPFGHASFYATGAYTTAILLKDTGVPHALVLVVSPLVAGAVGAICGLLIARLYRFYFAVMTQALSMVLWTVILKSKGFTGGYTGITGVEFTGILSGVNNTYLFTVIVVSLCVACLWLIINSPFGWTLRAIRENANRAAFTSIDVVKHRYLTFVMSSVFCGVAGTLYVVYSHTAFPDYAYWVKSGDMLMVCILGGMFSFLGPMIGAAILILLQTLVNPVTQYWPLVMGTVICGVVLLMPEGVMGISGKLHLFVYRGIASLGSHKK